MRGRRELAEEVGRAASRWTLVGEMDNSPGFTDEHTFCYLAEELTEVDADTQGVEEHFMTVENVPLADLWSLVESGELVDAKTIIAMALAERELALDVALSAAPASPRGASVLSLDAEEFLSYLAVERGRSHNSIASYRRDLLGYERFLSAKHLTLFEVRPEVIEEYLESLQHQHLAPSSRARALAALRGLHRFLADERGA